MTTALDFKCAWSGADDVRAAMDEVCAKIAQPSPSCVFFYFSPKYDLDEAARYLTAAFDCPVLACTTDGEIVPGWGYVKGGLAAASLGSPLLEVAQEVIPDVRSFDHAAALCMRERLTTALGEPGESEERRFGLLLIDGLSVREEYVAATIHAALDGMPMVGGSAADGGMLQKTSIFANGAFRSGGAVLTVFRTSLPFTTFMSHHFEARNERFVVTRADPEKRRLIEINGGPAAEFYLEQTGITRETFTVAQAASNPMIFPIGQDLYVRSVHGIDSDGGLSMFCAVEEGIVLRLGRPTDIVAALEHRRRDLAARVPHHRVILGFDCAGRRWNVDQNGLRGPMGELVGQMNLFAFSTYGEQYNGLHVNHTLTGVALGSEG